MAVKRGRLSPPPKRGSVHEGLVSEVTGMEGGGSSFMGNAAHLKKDIFCCRCQVVEAGLKAGGEATLKRVLEELP